MKTKTIITAIISGIFILSACTDYLNINPEASLPSADLDYTNTDNMFLPVSNAYASLRSNLAHGLAYIGIAGVTSDDEDKGSTTSDSPPMIELNSFSYTSSNLFIAEYWQGLYEVVSAANNAICNLPNFLPAIKEESEMKEYYANMAESKFIRAYAYFCLNRTWGGVPIVDTIVTSERLNTYQRATAEEVYTFIHKDLDDGVNYLPERYSADWAGRVTKYSAMALKAKVFLYQNKMDSVIKYTDMIINSGQYDLHRDFYRLFRVDGENNEESLFEIQSSDLGASSGPTAFCEYGYYQGPRSNRPSNMQGWGFKIPNTRLINFLKSRNDTIRLKATVMYRGSVTPDGDSIVVSCVNPYYNMKVYVPSSQNNWSFNGYAFDHNIRILRFADVLLMNAEAKVASGGDATTPLNRVRARAGLDPLTNVTIENVWDERRAELAMEENRFYDLVRTGRTNLLSGFKINKNELFPIPQKQLSLNPNLTQNPGY